MGKETVLALLLREKGHFVSGEAVSAELERQIPLLPRAEIARASIDNNGKIIVAEGNLSLAIDIANEIAPEHLELHLSNAMELLGAIHHAGAIFLGEWTPEAVGDYVAGPNHTLPTGGTARFSSPLSVDEFVKKSSVLQYSPAALMRDSEAVITLADHEGLWAHAQRVRLRRKLVEQAFEDAQAAGEVDGAAEAK